MNQKTYSFLVLTDHRVHHERNPIYSLLPELQVHPRCGSIHIASRGNPANDGFFLQHISTELEILALQESFEYIEGGEQFEATGQVSTLKDYDCILMRLTQPISSGFMSYLAAQAKDVVIINHPLGIEKTSSKAYLLQFPALCPPMKLCHSVEEIMDFSGQFPIVLKPLKEYGGKGILKIDGENLYEGNSKHIARDFLYKQAVYIQQEGYLAMKFMERVSQGDKRLVVVGGEILGASLRLPAEGSWLCNVAQGGQSVPAEIEPEEEEIIAQLAPALEQEGILIAGIDTLVGDDGKRTLSEINTVSVGGFLNIQEQSGKPIIKQVVQHIINYVHQKTRR